MPSSSTERKAREKKGRLGTHVTRIVELRRRERWRVVREEARDRVCLERRHREEVAEPAAAEDDLLARALGVVHCGARVDLSRANGGHEWARHWEVGAEARPTPAWLACGGGCQDAWFREGKE